MSAETRTRMSEINETLKGTLTSNGIEGAHPKVSSPASCNASSR